MKLTSNEPFWLVKNGLLHSYPSVKEDISADILIVGGGITGALISHQCIEDGYNTVLIDRREIANGSTSATTSMLQYEIDVPLYKLIDKIGRAGAEGCYWSCHQAIDRLADICKRVKSKCGFAKKDSLYTAFYKKDVGALRQEYEARAKAGIQVQWLEQQEIKKRYLMEHAYGGILSGQGGSMDAFRFAHDVLAYNQKRGLAVFDKTIIDKTDYKKNGVRVVTEEGHTIKARTIIYCNGFESVNLIKEKFVRLLSTYAIVGEVNEEESGYLKDLLVWDTADPYHYLRATDDHRLLVGGEDEDFLDTTRRDALLADKAVRLARHITRIFPGYRFRPDFAWAGTFGETEDGLPYIGSHPGFPHSYFVLGFGGNGITFSVMGMEIISAMLKKEHHLLEPYFRFGR